MQNIQPHHLTWIEGYYQEKYGNRIVENNRGMSIPKTWNLHNIIHHLPQSIKRTQTTKDGNRPLTDTDNLSDENKGEETIALRRSERIAAKQSTVNHKNT